MKIKDWNKFQHFKDRKPPWIKLYRDLLDDVEWHELDPKAAKVMVMLWLIASEDFGELPSIKKLAFRLRMSEKDVESHCSKLSHWLICDDINAISEQYRCDAPETEGETETKKEVEREVGSAKRRTQLPDDFEPNQLGKSKAVDKGLSCVEELLKFSDYHRGKGTVMLDWQAAWRTWISNARVPAPQKSGETPYQRAQREKMQQWAPGVAAKSPNQPFTLEAENVTFIEGH